jgi:hypothetical protein
MLTVFLLNSIPASAQLGDITKRMGLGKTTDLSDSKIASGLKEALQVGAGNAVKLTGQPDGYFKNEAIKIVMPKNLKALETGLRAIGFGPKVDDFVLSMNRAAEKAAPAAKQIFMDAILQMTIDDARKIFTGGDTAATEYFKSKTTEKLTAAFRPVISKSMSEIGVGQQFKELTGRYSSIPFAKMPAFDLDGYVVSKALDGLFLVLGDEERKIRTNPSAQVTSLLKEVFRK